MVQTMQHSTQNPFDRNKAGMSECGRWGQWLVDKQVLEKMGAKQITASDMPTEGQTVN